MFSALFLQIEDYMKNFYQSLASGSTGNCGLLVLGETRLLIDLGISVRRLKIALETVNLKIEKLDAILITHEHTDHIKGLATFVKKYDTPIYASRGTARVLFEKYPIIQNQLNSYDSGATLQIKDVSLKTVPTPHDAVESMGYIFWVQGIRFGYMTDLGFVPTPIRQALRGCTSVVLESNHDIYMLQYGCYPDLLKRRVGGPRGHLSNTDCANLAVDLVRNGTQQIILSHLSEKNNTPTRARLETQTALSDAGLSCQVFVAPVDIMQPITLYEEVCICYPSA